MKSIPRILTLATTILFSVVSQAQIYVSIEGGGDGTSWENTLTLTEALDRARAGEQIWVRGYENANEKQMYIPDSKDGFKLKSGVQLYGGFAGTETSIDERETLDFPYRLKYRSILSGDISKNDTLDAVNLIFPGNGTRDDNATHVLSIDMNPSSSSGNNNSYPTVVNGFTVTGGHAAAADGKGGGIYIYGDNSKGGIFRIEQCFLTYNYASQGGAVYVAEDVKDVNNNISLISQCVAYNNAAGERSVEENAGGGFYIAGEATVVNTSVFNNENGGMRISPNATVTNCTVARNSGAGIDLTQNTGAGNVHNTIIWGNSTLALQYSPTFSHSAFHEVADDDNNNNIYVSDKNRDKEYGPFFDAPSLSTGFDREYNGENTNYPTWSWDILEGTVMVNKGNSAAYEQNTYGSEDIKGRPRISGDTIDIGAQEYQFLPTSRRRYVKEGATGSGLSWDDASGDLQRMIDELANNNPQNLAGEVWVEKGEYEPQSQIISATTYSASFRMRDGISVYGGFAGTETTKQERAKGSMPWNYTNETILRGSAYTDNISWQTNRWTLTSDSRHVVWFAPLASENKAGFDRTTILDGVTIKGGYAQGGLGENEFQTDKGAGIYIALNAYAQNCIIKENHAKGNGGAAYINGGRLTNSLVFNNNSDANGGGVYIENAGIILACMITNNSANNGGGVYLNHSGAWSDGLNHPEYLILSTSVVSNNTSRNNGAVYCNKGGVLLQNTITNNNCPTATDNTDANASQTGGLYIDTYALVINSVLWNNTIQRMNIPMYARNASAQTVRFMNSALSGTNNAIWNNTLQSGIINLSESNDLMAEGTLTPDFDPTGMPNETGVDGSLQNVTYMWKPVSGSNLRARGMTLGTLPGEVLLAPEIDIEGLLFAQKPSTGAYSIEQPHITPEDDGNTLKIYVNADCTVHNHNGSSWEEAYRSLNEAIAYLAGLDATTVGNNRLEIHVQEGDLWPRYAFTNLDPRTATLSIPATQSGQPIYIYGGYAADTHERTPLTTRSVINGNNDGNNLNEGIYHCITVEAGAKAIIDGFHIINGYAAGEASMLYGAGMLVGDGAEVTVNNCIFENNTAQEGAAIDARNAKLTMNNCVVNNNTNTDETQPLINSNALTMNHVTVVNNLGAAPANMGSNSFATGNSSGNNKEALASVGADGAKNFANPTNNVGATLGFDTYLGGYAEFRPLTSSPDAAGLINKATGTPTELTADITGNERNLGGAPDLGAYEANLPKNGTVIYVTENGSGKMDGSSWENAIAGNMIYNVDEQRKIENVSTTNTKYIGFYDFTSRPYGEISGASKLFFEHLDESNLNSSNVNYRTESHEGATHVTGASGINIRNQRTERYVGGLQYAVERAAALAADDGEQRYVWVAGGTYTDYKGFVIRDRVDVLGGFPNVGTPGEDDRHPLISSYIPANEADTALNKTTYETIIQIQDKAPFTYSNGTYSANNLPGRTRKPVLFQPDVCLPTKSPSGRESSFSYWEWDRRWDWIDWEYFWTNHGYGNSVPGVNEDLSNEYRWQNKTPGEYQDDSGTYVEYSGATWDGFTIRHGFYTDYKANRDGGAGVRIFRGVTLRNCVVTENYINAHNNAGRGSGIYCDGNNSSVINCFVLNNANNSDESYGGGMYMILGTSYNTMVANNYAKSNGGGIFIEDAMFYNNTVAYNRSGGTGGLHQWTASSGTQTTLKLYNTIFYGNQNRAIGVSNTNNFNGAWNCYVQTSQTLDRAVQNKIKNSQIGTNLSSPFASSNAQQENNYRLAAGTWCLNNGTEEMGKDYLGNEIELPSTDVDFTDRIKDCAVDIGAYESENETNIAYETNSETNSLVYYVTQNGNGIRSGGSIDNAACAMKLQTILTHAGKTALANPGANVIVKVAGYDGASFVYHANTLENPNDPQSYTYTIPYGVTLMGGYNDESNDWSDANRKPMTYKTVLSAIALSNSLDEPDINGYHTVTFGEKPESWKGEDKKTIIDGIYLTDGKATAMTNTGNNIRGGGAIVPSWGHVRNCVVRDCQAVEGGGLYLLPGATVSGTAIIGNTAEEGGGIYANATGVTSSNRSHMVSCTITDNEATSVGGGVYMEGGALMSLNAVIWKNTAPSDKNISGEITSTFEDEIWHKHLESEIQEYYPFNYSFVETFELPSNFENTKMESTDSYFANEERILKAYSLLIKSGMKAEYQRALASALGIATADMQYIAREQNGIERVDAGAYAFEGGTLPTDKLITRIFVSQGTEIKLPDNVNVDEYIGRSFYTPLTKLERALEYIRVVRNNRVANNDTKFEILMAGGTYKPVLQRTSPTLPADQRLNSFIVPQGVSIYGGFSGEEMYSSTAYKQIEITSIPGIKGTFTCNGDISIILEKREFSDFNQNNIREPWELANQTILSGNINVSADAKNAYHVIFSNDGANSTGAKPITLDGLTITDGETSNTLSNVQDKDEIGRGGGIYSNGVSYIVNRCRFTNNFAVRGGAIYIRDARLTAINSIFAGNGTVDDPQTVSTYQPPRGGAVYIAGVLDSPATQAALYAVNTLWVNNETSGQGGAIGTNYADGIITAYVPMVSLMNNTFALNKAHSNAVIYHHNGKNSITNTLMWGNVATDANIPAGETNTNITYSASDATDLSEYGSFNIRLSAVNTDVNGPRFARPSTVAGTAGNNAYNCWNPAAISILTDTGNGTQAADDSKVYGAYEDWWTEAECPEYKNQYMHEGYLRYAGPRNEDGTQADKPIDIGVYEYQYNPKFSNMDTIYVATSESGLADGTSWSNATSDLRGALVALANPDGGESKNKAVLVKAGSYTSSLLSAQVAFPVSLSSTDFGTSLTIKGSYNESGLQDFSQPTIITTQENKVNTTNILMDIATTADKPVNIDGFTFINKNPNGGTGMHANSSGGKITIKQLAFRGNKGNGLQVENGNNGPILIANTLFADGGTGLADANDEVTVVNATFANNSTDVTGTGYGMYNSVSWNNGTQNLPSDNNNRKIAGGITNTDIQKGPNFLDPDTTDVYMRDYRIRPSITLLNQGDNSIYEALVEHPANEKDLANNARLVDDKIDVGAYEYEAALRPIVYVKADLTGNHDGNSWATALDDLQGAVDLAGIYAQSHEGENGYVFVHNNYNDEKEIRISLGNTKVYGGMNDETSDETSDDTETENIVNDIIGKRRGVLESNRRSTLGSISINANSVVDGFEITGTASVNDGILSTSIADNGVSGQENGTLYNTFVTGDVASVKAINVTATGSTANAANESTNNISGAQANSYVTDPLWNYQLAETSADINAGNNDPTLECIKMVRHSRDLIGNARIRNAVDNGCFETWNIISNDTITTTDKPIGKSVVYVRRGYELKIEKADNGTLVYNDANAFNPGFLLLEHQAGLRGCGNHISLDNFAIERDVKANDANMFVAPFNVILKENADGLTFKRYSGRTRAGYDYKFDETDGIAWTQDNQITFGNTEGVLVENTTENDKTLRLYGNSYEENGNAKSVQLAKYNFNDPWSSDEPTGNKFTHKENMSWNLFGSPFLCALNYNDMEYGRVVYGYVYGYANGSYVTVNTEGNNGHIPAFDAVFTQTATLKDNETVNITPLSDREGTAYASTQNLAIALKAVNANNEGSDVAEADDILELNAVPAEESRSDFDISGDGVKWMSTSGKPQLYAVRNSARYSLLSAVSEEEVITIGFTASKADSYEFEALNNENYQTVELTDHKTGKTVDLKTTNYIFNQEENTNTDNRFTLRFISSGANSVEATGVKIELLDNRRVRISGLRENDRIQIYDTSGVLEMRHIAKKDEYVFSLQPGIHIIDVRAGQKKRAASKIIVQ